MHDLKLIRDNPQYFDLQMKNRNMENVSQEILKIDKKK